MVLVTLQSPACLKPFVKAVNALGKIGDEAFLEITEEAMYFQAANSSTTAIVYFRFDRRFFTNYDTRIATVTRSQADKSVGYAVKLSSRCLANCMRMVAVSLAGVSTGLSSGGHDDSSSKSSLSVRYDTVTFECVHPAMGSSQSSSSSNSSDYPDEDLTVRLSCSSLEVGQTKTTTFKLLPLDTSEMLAEDFAAATLRSATNHLSAPAKKFSDLLANFATSDRNLLFCLSPTRFSLAADPLGKSGRWHRIGTDQVGPASVFTRYEVMEEVNFGCILAELKTFLNYATSLDWSPMLHIDFSDPGRPIVFSVEVADRLGVGDATASITMGSLVLSTMTLAPGVSAAAANAAPAAKTSAAKRDKTQPLIDTVLKSNTANRGARRFQQDEVIELDLNPSPIIRSSLDGRPQGNATISSVASPTVPSRRGPSIVSFSDPERQNQTNQVPMLFSELFAGGDATDLDELMVPSRGTDVLAGDSDPEN